MLSDACHLNRSAIPTRIPENKELVFLCYHDGKTEIFLGEAMVNGICQITPGFWLLRLDCPSIAHTAEPGQFVHLLCGGGVNSLMRRPLSLHRVDRVKDELSILFQVHGEGTKWLAGRREGDRVNIIGPLGHGFPRPQGNRALLVAGGLGVAPLLFLAESLQRDGVKVSFLMGAKSADLLLREAELQALGIHVEVATDDGSRGYHGLVTDLMESHLVVPEEPVAVYACGPTPMMEKVAQIAGASQLPCWVSLEERMACGLGACRGCSVRIKDRNGELRYENACSYGPVFDAQEVIWHAN